MMDKGRDKTPAWSGTPPLPRRKHRTACCMFQVQGRNGAPGHRVQGSRDSGTSHEIEQLKQEAIQAHVITAVVCKRCSREEGMPGAGVVARGRHWTRK